MSGLQEENAWQVFRAQCGAEVCFNYLSGELRTTDGNQTASSSSSDRVDWTSLAPNHCCPDENVLRTTDGNQTASSSSSDRADWTSWHQTIAARMKTSCLPQHDWKGPSDRGSHSSWSKVPGTCKDVLAENPPDKPMAVQGSCASLLVWIFLGMLPNVHAQRLMPKSSLCIARLTRWRYRSSSEAYSCRTPLCM